jgi:hypothetical protein
MHIMFFPNGNTSVCENDRQVPNMGRMERLMTELDQIKEVIK